MEKSTNTVLRELLDICDKQKEESYRDGRYEFRAGISWVVDRICELITTPSADGTSDQQKAVA